MLQTTVTLFAVVLGSWPCHALRAQANADRLEALVEADRSASASSWKLGLRGALIEASDHDGVLLLPGAPLVIGMPVALRDLTNAPPPLSSKVTWDPLGSEISADSSLALLWGAASLTSGPEAPATGRFVCMWRYADSRWKIAALALQGSAYTYRGPALASAPAASPGQDSEKFFKADRDFARLAADSGVARAFQSWAASDAMMFGRHGLIIRGPETIGRAVDGPAKWWWAPMAGGGSSTGDLGWTAGEAVISPEEGAPIKTKYLSVWRTGPDGLVRFILDAGSVRP
jgi:hypothetical protein